MHNQVFCHHNVVLDGLVIACDRDAQGNQDYTFPPIIKPSAEKMNIGHGAISNLSAAGQPILWIFNDYMRDYGNTRALNGYAVRSDQPNEIFSQNLIVAKKILADRKNQDIRDRKANDAAIALHKSQEAAGMAQAHKELTQTAARIATFRANVREGDTATAGLIVHISGNLILIQTPTGQRWFNRSQIYPPFCANTIMC